MGERLLFKNNAIMDQFLRSSYINKSVNKCMCIAFYCFIFHAFYPKRTLQKQNRKHNFITYFWASAFLFLLFELIWPRLRPSDNRAEMFLFTFLFPPKRQSGLLHKRLRWWPLTVWRTGRFLWFFWNGFNISWLLFTL